MVEVPEYAEAASVGSLLLVKLLRNVHVIKVDFFIVRLALPKRDRTLDVLPVQCCGSTSSFVSNGGNVSIMRRMT